VPKQARTYINATIVAGISFLLVAAFHWRSSDPLRFVTFYLLGLVISTYKVRLPRIQGTVSGGFVFVLIAIAEFSFSEAIVMAVSTALVQCLWGMKRRQVPRQLLFNLATMVNSATVAYLPRYILNSVKFEEPTICLLVASILYFWVNNLSVLTALALVEDKPVRTIWSQCSLWSQWYFFIQVGLAVLVSICVRLEGWVFSFALIVILILLQAAFKRIAKFFANVKRQERRAKRYDGINATAELSWMDRHGAIHSANARILDVSELGMRIESPEPFSASTVHISAPEHSIDSHGEIRYCHFTSGKYVAGIEFHLILTERQLLSVLQTRE
jgi:hypothetical protein